VSSGSPWLLPDEPRAIRLMNTIWADRTGVHDDLASPEGAMAWFGEVELLDERAEIGADELAQARRLRDAARALAAWMTEDPRPIAEDTRDVDDAIATINQVAIASPPVPQLRRVGAGLDRQPVSAGSAVATALSSLAEETADLLTGELSPELRACLAPRCVLYYVRQDARRVWCSPGCGNRARVARHHRRTRESAR
jgi:predicted RNA-binding Zn ribbon-like protein